MFYLDNSNYNSITLWPDNKVDKDTIIVNVTIFLTQTLYLEHKKVEVNEQEVSLLAAQKKAAPAILAGLEEGIRLDLVDNQVWSYYRIIL